MWLIHVAMRRPITVLMVILGVALASALALNRMKADIFPDLGTPVIYVAQPYGGMDPAQMEGYLVNYYEYHFLYIRGIDHVESRSIQGAALMKLYFHEGNGHGDSDGRDGCPGQPVALVHATRNGTAVHHALRRRKCPGGLSCLFKRDTQRQ